MKKVGIGIIGSGFAMRAHLPAFRADKRCEVLAIALSTDRKALLVAREFGIPKSFGSWKKMIEDPKIDAISIAVPAILQGDIIRYAIKHRKPFFIEKPLAVDLSTAQALTRDVVASKLPHVIDFELPQTAAWSKAKKLVESGKLGQIRHVLLNWHLETAANRKGERSWKTESAQGGGALNLFASHSFHYLEWLLGPIDAVNARLLKGAGIVGDQETLCAIRVRFKPGFYGNLTVSSHCIHGSGHRLEVYGDRGTLSLINGATDALDQFQLFFGSRKDKVLRRVSTNIPRKPRRVGGRIGAVSALISAFVSAVIKKGKAKPDIHDGLRVQELLDAVRRSHAASGQAVFL